MSEEKEKIINTFNNAWNRKIASENSYGKLASKEMFENKNICRETCEYFKRICNENTLLIKYRSVLEEIRDILKHRPYLSNGDVEHIARRIDEVLNENTEN